MTRSTTVSHASRRLLFTGLSLTAGAVALLPSMAMAYPWPIQQTSWNGTYHDYPLPTAQASPWWNKNRTRGYQAYGPVPLTPEQQAQRCNTGRLIGGLGGGAAAYAMSRGNGRAWAIPLGALLGSQVGCNAAAGRGPLPW